MGRKRDHLECNPVFSYTNDEDVDVIRVACNCNSIFLKVHAFLL